MSLCKKGTIDSPYWGHPGRDCIALFIFLNVSEVPNGSTAGSKEVRVLVLAVKVSNRHCEESPLLPVEVFHSTVNACFDSCVPLRTARYLALNLHNFRVAIVMSNFLDTFQFGHMNCASDCHSTTGVLLCLNTVKEYAEEGESA